MTQLDGALKRYVYVYVDYRPHLRRTVSHNALRVAGALNGRNNVTIMKYEAMRETWWYA